MKRGSPEIIFSRCLLLYAALLILIIPFRLLAAMIISAVVHELFHIGTLFALNVKVNAIYIGVLGAQISTEPVSKHKELLSAAAGPLGGFLLFLCHRWIPVISLCALVHSCYNLLPVYPSDGGRIIRCVITMLWNGKRANQVVCAVEIVSLSVIVGACIYGAVFLSLGILPVFLSAILLLNGVRRK